MKHFAISHFFIGALALSALGQETGAGGPKPSPTAKPVEIHCDIQSWAGEWKTNWGVMKLQFDDEKFSGNYGPSKHAVSGRFDPKSPCVLRGVWQHTNSDFTGRFTFHFTGPKSFKGNWSSGNADPDVAGSPWTGTRLAALVVGLPKKLTLAQLELEQSNHRAKLNSEYRKAYREILNEQIAEVTALRKKYSQRRDNQKAADATRMLAELRRLLDSFPLEEKIMPPEEPELDGPGLIKDPKLEVALRDAMGKPTGVITPSDLASLKKLEAPFLGITDISGLEHATNLTSLNLSHNPITDITPLAGLTKLKRLLIYKIRITDLKPLADLTQVEFVTFWETNVSDLTPLKSWKKLHSIELRLTKVTDYTPLHGLTNLKSLATNRRLISDEQLAMLKKALPNCKLEIEKRNLQLQ